MDRDKALRWAHKLMDSPLVGATATRIVAEDIFIKYSSTVKSKGMCVSVSVSYVNVSFVSVSYVSVSLVLYMYVR